MYVRGVGNCSRCHDEFEPINGEWRFCYRDYSLHDMPSDMSRHIVQRRLAFP